VQNQTGPSACHHFHIRDYVRGANTLFLSIMSKTNQVLKMFMGRKVAQNFDFGLFRFKENI